MKNLRLAEQKGISQIFILVIMLVLAISLPIAMKLVQQSTDNRSHAMDIQAAKGACLASCTVSVNVALGVVGPAGWAAAAILNPAKNCDSWCNAIVAVGCASFEVAKPITTTGCFVTCKTPFLVVPLVGGAIGDSACLPICKSIINALQCTSTATNTSCGNGHNNGAVWCSTGRDGSPVAIKCNNGLESQTVCTKTTCSNGACNAVSSVKSGDEQCGALNGTCQGGATLEASCKTASGASGTYKSASEEGKSGSLCGSDPSTSYRCCVPGASAYVPPAANDSGCNALHGQCMDVGSNAANQANGALCDAGAGQISVATSGVNCHGGDNIRCCVQTNCTKNHAEGSKCMDVGNNQSQGASCNGGAGHLEVATSGVNCPGGDNIRCCVPNPPPVCNPNCSCAAETSVGSTCSNGCGGTCNGTKPVCGPNCSCSADTTVGQTCSDGCGGTCPGVKPVPVVCNPNCSCAAETSVGSTCSDGCNGTCNGTKPLPTTVPTIRPTVAPTVVPTAVIVPKISFKFAFAGVKPGAACISSLGKLGVEVGNLPTNGYQNGLTTGFSAVANAVDTDGNQVFEVNGLSLDAAKFANVNNNNYVKIKGLLNLKRRMCLDGQSTKLNSDTTICNIDLTRTDGYVYDFSKYMLLAGDVNGDGVINSIDFSYVKTRLSAGSDVSCGREGDLNADGVVNNLDVGLVKIALSSRDDE
jgi:hypothetical protein